jgi:tetratricopeptide (TPR) repeat protein
MKEMTTAEMVRVVCEQPPHRPSQRTASGQRLDGDLEAILLKALRKEPGMRYLSAEQLAGDLKAYLAGRPVAARHGTLRYRAGKFIRRNRLALTAACLLAATLLAGVVGVAWQAHVANRQRRKAEARSADLRQLSNSLLSELNEAIKELPGSTGAQKLLVTRVLDHLDRMGKDTQGDRQTQLDLADAYIQLGEIQGDPYVQNIGEPLAALISLDKAIKVTAPLAAANAADHEAVRSLAVAQQYRSDVLFGMNRTQEAVVSMQASVGAWDQLVAARDVTPALLCDAGSAFGTLGDEEGQSGTASLGDPVAAEAAYRKALAADARALAIDPHLARATRGLAIYRMKIGSLVAETDPARAIPEFQGAMRSIEALPDAVRNTLSSARLRAVLQRKQAIALEHTGEYAQAMPLFKEAIAFHQNAVAQDPKDFRALLDLVVALDDESLAYEDAANPVLGTRPGDRRNNLLHVRSDLLQSTADLDRLLSHDPDHNDWKTFLGLMQVRLDSAERALHSPGATGERSRKSIAAAKLLAASGQASPEILNQTASAILLSATASRTDLQSAVSISERDVKLCHGLRPEHVLVLAEAYRATGQIEKSRTTAKQGLALLPSVESGAPKSNIRKLLEIQAK